jgi:hypothetical protein
MNDPVRFDQPTTDVARQRNAVPDRADEHVHFGVFTEQVLVAHQPGRDFPHSHGGLRDSMATC